MDTCRFCHQLTIKEFCDENCYKEYQEALKEMNKQNDLIQRLVNELQKFVNNNEPHYADVDDWDHYLDTKDLLYEARKTLLNEL